MQIFSQTQPIFLCLTEILPFFSVISYHKLPDVVLSRVSLMKVLNYIHCCCVQCNERIFIPTSYYFCQSFFLFFSFWKRSAPQEEIFARASIATPSPLPVLIKYVPHILRVHQSCKSHIKISTDLLTGTVHTAQNTDG
jgi:hypothetical protein